MFFNKSVFFKMFWNIKVTNFSMFMNFFIFLTLYLMFQYGDNPSNLSSTFIIDMFNFPIIIMTIFLMMTYNLANFYSLNLIMIMFFSCITFSVNSLILFYIFFELNLVPIFLLIMGWGYQPERIYATKMMIMYTLFGSLPMLVMLINFQMMDQISISFLSQSSFFDNIMPIFMILALLIKLPIFLLHMWLPLAHVEAPLMGSMVLASVMLKLGGYGLVRLMSVVMNPINSLNHFLFSIFIMGGTMAMLFCITQVDLKIIIAYSSVGHMSMVAATLFSYSWSGFLAAMIMMIAHGFTSSLMFFCAGMMYMKSNSRHMLMNKGTLTLSPKIVLFWFLALLMNAGGPPKSNLMSEILTVFSLISTSYFSFIPLVVSLMLGMLFNMKMYSITSQGSLTNNFFSGQELMLSWKMSAYFHIMLAFLMILSMPYMMNFFSDLMFFVVLDYYQVETEL
uniref:NADH-ubiquinone oxidoreductase chain 4 n=1 Tax=Caligus clemensi TaxID=344056 RepID=E1B2Q2_CALCM|nr:NADH dehydrogenase subunit 4 [Caligus clemensi]